VSSSIFDIEDQAGLSGGCDQNFGLVQTHKGEAFRDLKEFCAGFKILTAAAVTVTVFWDVVTDV
jgi:hypothetical protein